ncbi:hypothetical protein ES705_36924 [subsurface metagenome]
MKTRTLIIFGFAVVLALSFAGIVLAADVNSIATQQVEASITFIEEPATGTMTVKIKNIDGDADASKLSWTNVTLGTTKWLASDQYLEIDKDFSRTGWGIQIYTDNLQSGTTEYNPAGLAPTTGDPRVGTLSLAWRMMGETTTYAHLGIQEVSDLADPTLHHLESTDIPGEGYYPWVWMKDPGLTRNIPERHITQFVPGEDYVTVWDNRGVHHAEGPLDYYPSPGPNYLYIATNFETATTPETYTTDKLTLELFWQ